MMGVGQKSSAPRRALSNPHKRACAWTFTPMGVIHSSWGKILTPTAWPKKPVGKKDRRLGAKLRPVRPADTPTLDSDSTQGAKLKKVLEATNLVTEVVGILLLTLPEI